jgi:hypothetical protein
MPKVAFLLHDAGPDAAKVTVLMRRELGVSSDELRRALGTERPVFERSLYGRKDPEFPHQLINAMRELDVLGARYDAYQLLQDQSYSSGMKFFRLTPENLEASLEARAQSINQQRSLARLEEDQD